MFSLISRALIASLIVVFPYEGSASVDAEIPQKAEILHKANSCKVDAINSSVKKSCQTTFLSDADILKLQEESFAKVEDVQNDRSFQEFQTQVLKKNDEVLNSDAFQELVTDLKQAQRKNAQSFTEPSEYTSPGELYIFVSFSLGEKALLNLASDAKQFDATLVLRGFIEGTPGSSARGQGYTKTAQALQKIIRTTGQGVIIDPELYTLFAVRAVPTFILTKPFQLQAQERTQTPLHDRMQGHVSAHYALEIFSQEGDLKIEAKALLLKGVSK